LFFRRKRYSEVEGYERISRMIEDRQAEAGEEIDDDDRDEDDTVLLRREPGAPSHAAESGAHQGGTAQDASAIEGAVERAVEESVTLVRPNERAAAARPASEPAAADHAAWEPPATVTPAEAPPPTPAVVEPPRMAMPDLTSLASSAGGASLVAKDATWEGKLVCTGNVRIEGSLRGEVETTGTLYVAAEARVDGTVRAQNVTLAGELQGNVRCEGRLEILPGGAARGEVDTGALVVHEGAFIESRFQMRQEAAPVH
jgi:cytoskeletal protein CcmA (bactofilin family)